MVRLTSKLIFAFILLVSWSARAQKESDTLQMLSLEELMNLPISVGSQKTQSVKTTPGSITVLTEEMIKSSGARDLDELLMKVPGFDIGNDYGNVLSFGVRGNWANEGKILVMVDGLIINETNYGTAPLSQRFPLRHIKQIEIIRGSGSVIYGGVAALAVVSIKTRKGNEVEGFEVTTNTGFSNNAFSRNNIEMSYGKEYKNGLNLSVHGGYNQGNNSNRIYHSPVGDSVLNYKNNSQIVSRYLNVNLGYKNFELHVLNEDFKVSRTNDQLGNLYTYFSGSHIGSSYTFKSAKWTVTPSISVKSHQPWNVLGGPAQQSNIRSYRWMSSLKALYAASKNFDIMTGAEYYGILSNYMEAQSPTFANGRKSFQVSNLALFSELLFHKKSTNVSAGFRFDNHSTAGSAFVPRFALTQQIGKVNLKATYSRSFKTPLIYNIKLNPMIKPEYVQMIELETAFQLSSNLLFTLNLYNIKIEKSIIYNYDQNTQVESYVNEGTSGTRGLEAELRYSGKKSYVTFNYSLYHAAYHGVASFQIANNNSAFLGLPTQKLSVTSSFYITNKLLLSPSLLMIGKRTSLIYNNKTAGYDLYQANEFIGLNTLLTYENALFNGFSITAGWYDILDQKLFFLPAYNSGLAPQPAQGQEFLIKLNYKMP